MRYRKEIDGLRCVAVLPVVMHHAGFSIFSGGYIGVDVFFVISGFLITTIIIEELVQNHFSIIGFYERRARRILPALFTMIFLCIPFAWFWLSPSQLKDFSQSIVAVTLFSSNFLFWLEEGYFSPIAELKPLLHTWSLAVEEQYYLFFPPLLILIWQFGRTKVMWMLIVISIASVGIAEWGWRNAPEANFYLAPARVWELLVGSLCAFWKRENRHRPLEVLALFGLAMIVVPIFIYNPSTPFPSLWAVVPVFGTALVIMFAYDDNITAKLLSNPVFVGVGMISYSLYLWHQPIFAFARLRSILAPSPMLMMALIILSFLMAYLSWRYIEKPFRTRPGPKALTRHQIFAASSIFGLCFIAFGVIGHVQNGFPQRSAPSGASFASLNNKIDNDIMPCDSDLTLMSAPNATPENCRRAPVGNTSARAIIIGDSHARALAGPVSRRLVELDIAVEVINFGGCPPFRGIAFPGRDCWTANNKLFKYIEHQAFDYIIIAFRPQPLFQKNFDNLEGGIEQSPFPTPLYGLDFIGSEKNMTIEQNAITTINKGLNDFLSLDAEIILIYPVPEAGWNVSELLWKLAAFRKDVGTQNLSTDGKLYWSRNAQVLKAFDAVKSKRLHRIRPSNIFCDTYTSNRCVNVVNGTSFYDDDDHLNIHGARLVASKIATTISDIVEQ